MPDETVGIRRNLEQQLISRAWKDPDFRRELLKNPREAIERELGLSIPVEINVAVHEETPTSVHLVLPVNPAEQSKLELSDEELKANEYNAWTSEGCGTGGSACTACVGGVRG